MIKIEDNFLGWNEFSKLQSLMMSNHNEENGGMYLFPWTYHDKIDYADDKDIIFASDDGSGGTETYFFLDG